MNVNGVNPTPFTLKLKDISKISTFSYISLL